MNLPTQKELEKIRDKNKSSDKEWKVVCKFLQTGICNSKEEALICNRNMQENLNWYENDFADFLTKKHLKTIRKIIKISGYSAAIAFSFGFHGLLLAIVMMDKINAVGFICTFLITNILGAIILNCYPDYLEDFIIQKMDNKILKRLKKKIKSKLDSKEEKKITIDEKACDNSYLKKDVSDVYLQEIKGLSDLISKAQYTDYQNDLNFLKIIASDYARQGKDWSDLDMSEQMEWINKLVNVRIAIFNRIKTIAKRNNLERQVDAIFKDKASDGKVFDSNDISLPNEYFDNDAYASENFENQKSGLSRSLKQKDAFKYPHH